MIPAAVIDGDEWHARLHEPPGEQAPLAKGAATIFLAYPRGLAVDIERLLRLARADETITLFVEPIDVADRIGRRFVVEPYHSIDELPQVLATFESSLAQVARNRHVTDAEVRAVWAFFDDERGVLGT